METYNKSKQNTKTMHTNNAER